MTDEALKKMSKARCYVRVRPFTDAEAKVCPEDSPVPREAIAWDGKGTLTVLDPRDNFRPRKNGEFDVENVFWSFVDAEEPKGVITTQKDVYETLVTPVIPSIVAGYNAAFCVAGAPESGRIYSMYGDEVEGAQRGILPRFAEDIFHAFSKNSRDNATMTAELEAIDISATETYVDLLAKRGRGAPAPELKLANDPTGGVRLQGATQVSLRTSADLLNALKQLFRMVQKRTTTHSVSIRFTETYAFQDPDNPSQSVSKSRHVRVLFAILRNMPAAFQRCINVAVEHDSGENPLAKVPTRETAFTKLYPELLTQGYHLNCIVSVSPFYEHVKETVNMLTFATSMRKLRCKPTLTQDESLVEMRQLADEVKDLKLAVRKQSESMDIVQRELNAREVELMKQEATHHECKAALEKSEEKKAVANIARKMQLERTKIMIEQNNSELVKAKKRINATHTSKVATGKEIEATKAATNEINARVKTIDDKIAAQDAVNRGHAAQLEEYTTKTKEVERMQAFINAAPEERRAEVARTSGELGTATAEVEQLEEEQKTAAVEFKAAEERYNEAKPGYDVVYAAEKGSREKAELTKEISRLETEIEDAEAELQRLRTELDAQPKGCCAVM